MIVADPDNPQCLFVIDDEMKLLKILDNGEGKAVIVGSVDMTNHDLEEEIVNIENRPWTSITICDRMVSFGEYSFSLQTKFFWKDETVTKDQHLVEERNLPGTLLSLQLWSLQNGDSVFRFKPLSGSNKIELMG